MTEQLALLAVGRARVQVVLLKVPVPVGVKVTVPVGADLVGASVSVTVAVQVLAWLSATGFSEQLTVVEVVRLFTVRGVEPELVAWTVSPP